ncbi:MAG: PQQ-dependent sugar dehydrogenase [Minisyncoccia bacterium]
MLRIKNSIILSLVLLAFFVAKDVEAVPSNFVNETVINSGINLPTMLEFLPDGRMLIGEFNGRIIVAQPGANTVDPTPVLTITNIFGDDIISGGERGLVGITIDPNFSSNQYIYVFYTSNIPQRDRVSRFTMVGNSANPSSEVIIWQAVADSTHTDHHGGGLGFGPDGKLYITTGDNGDPSSSQSLSSDHGKILRVNADGTVPTDGPFFDGAGPNIDSIYARGLRNPYRIFFDIDGKLYIGDVGQLTWEEIDIGVSGANYGWPICEGTCGTSGMTNPILAYPHFNGEASVTGGLIYRGTQFPVQYRGAYFYGDYALNWIKYLTFDASGSLTSNVNFEPIDGSNNGPYGDPVDFAVGPDGSLYYVDFGFGVPNPASIKRIRYVASNLPPLVVASSTPTEGLPPLAVNFSSIGSSDPENNPLTYLWNFGDNATSSQSNPTHVYGSQGLYTATLTLSDGNSSSVSNPIIISVGNKPVGEITSPSNNALFRAGDVINFSGTASDVEDGTNLPSSAYSWTVLFHHESHVHPAHGPVSGPSGTFTISNSGHDFSGNTSYEFILTVTDSSGLKHVSSTTIFPEKVDLTFNSNPSGLTLIIDGIPQITPLVKNSLIGFQYTVDAINQSSVSNNYTFQSWSDNGAQSHIITTPITNQTYTATFNTSPTANISFDTSVNSGDLSNLTSASWTHTTSGLNRYLIVGLAGWDNNSSLSGVTVSYAGVTMTKLGGQQTVANNNAVLWGLANPTLGSNLVSVTNIPASFLELGGGSLSFTNVDQASSTGLLVTGITNTANINLSNVDMGVDILYDGQNGSTINYPTPGANETMRVNTTFSKDGGNNRDYMMMGIETGTGTIQMDWLGHGDYAIAAVPIKAISGSSTPDTTAPVLSNGTPNGILPDGTTQTTISLISNENATCRYSTTANTTYISMTGNFTNTGTTTHSTVVSGLSNGNNYTYNVRCIDSSNNANQTDFPISFSINNPPPPDTIAPTVNITAPTTNSTISGTVFVNANASDNIGVVGVQFLLDGNNLGTEDTSSPYSTSWNTATTTQGAHILTARARDVAGNVSTSSPININVNNSIPGLVAAYSFNEGFGTSLYDVSGNLNLGTIDGATWTLTGKYGNALIFDGSNDWVTVADSNSLDLTNSITIEAWVNPSILPKGWRTIVAKEQNDGLMYYLYASSRSANQPAQGVFVNNAERNLVGGTRLAINTWTHVAMTYNGSIQRLYINGVQVATRNQTGSMTNSTGVLRIGGNNQFGEFFNGMVDEVRIWNTVRTQTQIQTDMNTPIP